MDAVCDLDETPFGRWMDAIADLSLNNIFCVSLFIGFVWSCSGLDLGLFGSLVCAFVAALPVTLLLSFAWFTFLFVLLLLDSVLLMSAAMLSALRHRDATTR